MLSKKTFVIAGREIKSSFSTPLAYVIFASFILISGFFFFALLEQFNSLLVQAAMIPGSAPNLNEYVVAPFFNTLQVVLIFLIPLISMKSIAEEKSNGTFELLYTSPLKVSEIVYGKFYGLSVVLISMLLLSFCFPLVLVIFSDPEIMPILTGFVGLVLLSLSFLALGIAVSAFTKSQIVSGIISMVLLLLLYVADAGAEQLGDFWREFLSYLAPTTHTEQIIRGALSSGNLVYFVSLIALGLFIASRALDAGRWR